MSFVYAGQYTEAVLGRGASGTGTFLQSAMAVNVYQVGTTTPVTLYTDRTKGITTANPVNTDAGGNLTFYADPGHYDLVFTPAGGTSQRVSVVVPVDPGELSAAYRSLFAKSDVVFLGDSITASGDGAGNWTLTWSLLLPMLSMQRLRHKAIKGVASNTTAQMLARIQADVIALAPTYCVVLGGTNDATLADMTAGLTSIYNALDGAGIQVIACTLPPNDSAPATPQQRNVWIAETAHKRGYPLLDHYSALVDPSTGHYATGMSLDGVHPSYKGHGAMAAAALTVLDKYLPARSPWMTASDADTSNLLYSGCFTKPRILGDGVTPYAPDGYGWVSSLPGGGTISRTAAGGVGAAPIGNWSKIVCAAVGSAGTVQSYQDQGPTYITTGFAVGDVLEISARIQTTGCLAGGVPPAISLDCSHAGTNIADVSINGGSVGDITDGIFLERLTVPATTDRIMVSYGFGAPTAPGNGTLFFERITVRNLTALGLV